MRRYERVRLREDPTVRGTVIMTKAAERRAFVVWDGEYSGSHHLSELERLGERGEEDSSPSLIYAPEISDLQYVTRLDPETDSPYMERSDDYRGRGSPFPTIESAADVYELFHRMGELDREHIVVGLLNVRNELIGWKVAHVGDLASVEASGRSIIRDAFLGNAAGIVVLHNHPTGDPAPSEADKELTDFLVKRAAMDEIGFFDHVIIGIDADHHEPYYSFRDNGQIEDGETE